MNAQQFTDWMERQYKLSPENFQEKPLVMGILNVTPDSFSDGGKFLSKDAAWEHAFHLIDHGADLIDVGGQSTRPGAMEVSVDIEMSRVIPVLEQIRLHSDVCISIDTNKPEVMEAAVCAGANMINDVYALRTKESLLMAAKLAVPVCLMHMQGEPHNMQDDPHYKNGVIAEVMQFFNNRIGACEEVGISKKKIILDPGFGFGKKIQDNLLLINKLDSFASFGLPILLGVSRKSTIGAVLAKGISERLIGSIAATVYAALKGVRIIRTHDVDETHQALHFIERIGQVACKYS